MKKNFILILTFCCITLLNAQEISWKTMIDYPGMDHIIEILPVDNEQFLLIGQTYKTESTDHKIWMVGIDRQGNKLFEQFYEAAHNLLPFAAFLDDQGVTILSNHLVNAENGNVLIIETDQSGKETNRYSILDNERQHFESATRQGNQFTLAGNKNRTGYSDLYIVTIKNQAVSNAKIIPRKASKKDAWDIPMIKPNHIQTMKDGQLIVSGHRTDEKVTGFYTLSLNSLLNIDWKYYYSTMGGDYLVSSYEFDNGGVGYFGVQYDKNSGAFHNNNLYKGLFLELDQQGNFVQSDSISLNRYDVIKATTKTSNETYLAVGHTSHDFQQPNGWIFEYHRTEGVRWQKEIDGYGSLKLLAVKEISPNEFICAGAVRDNSTKMQDVLIFNLQINQP